MGNRLAGLPFPSMVGGSFPDEDVNLKSPRGGGYDSEPDGPVERDADKQPLLYAAAFFLKAEESEKYLQAGEAYQCLLSGDIKTTSLLTFHAERGEQVNYRGNQYFTPVQDGDVVTIYANIRGENENESVGQYLTPFAEKAAAPKTNSQPPAPLSPPPKDTKRLAWKGSPEKIKSFPERFEFIVRRKQPLNHARSKSFRQKFKLQFSFKRESSSSIASDKGPSLRRGSRTPPPDYEVGSGGSNKERLKDVARPMTPPVLGSRHKLSSSAAGDDAPPCSSEEVGAPGLATSALVDDIAHVVQQSKAAPTLENADEAAATTDPLMMGECVSLEYKLRPGYFVFVKPNGSVQLSGSDVTYFKVSMPQLRDLVTLNDGKNARNQSKILDPSVQASRTKRAISETEASWLRLLKRLPLDIVYRVLQYKGNWVRITRLVCKDWCRAANLHVFRIRVNNSPFTEIDTPRKRTHMLQFVSQCVHVTKLTLRNIDEMQDWELAKISGCVHLRHLEVGGCKSLTDKCLDHIVPLKNLSVLNLATTAITDAGLKRILVEIPSVTILNLYCCPNVTPAGLQQVMKLPLLGSVNIRGCRIQKADEKSLQRQFPDVQLHTGPPNLDGIY